MKLSSVSSSAIMAKFTVLVICISLVVKFALPQVSFAREWVRSKYTSDDDQSSELEIPTKVRRIMAARFNSKVVMPLPRTKGKPQWPVTSLAESTSSAPPADGLTDIQTWLKNCGLTWFDSERKGFIVFLLDDKCNPSL